MSKRLSQAKNHLDQARPKNKSDGVHVVTNPDAVKSSANSKIESKSVKQIFDDATVLDAGKKEAQPKGKSTVDPDKPTAVKPTIGLRERNGTRSTGT